MNCKLDSDDRCITPGHTRTPVEHMAWCPHDGNVCDHSQCRHPDCHQVRSRRVQVPPFGARLIAYCTLCGEKSMKPGDAEDVRMWETAHLAAVAK